VSLLEGRTAMPPTADPGPAATSVQGTGIGHRFSARRAGGESSLPGSEAFRQHAEGLVQTDEVNGVPVLGRDTVLDP
jgi:hypothetical protein